MNKLLIISNRRFGEPGGRGTKFETRDRYLGERGWRLVLGYVPEPYVRTFLPSILRCWRLARRQDADVVMSISNPLHLQLIGFAVSLLTGLPWVVEFRDPMVYNPDRDPDAMLTKLAGLVERLAVTRADQVLWHDGMQMPREYFAETYPMVDLDRFFQLPFFGFHRAKFEDAEAVEYDGFTITYAGSFYDGWIEPFEFIKGLGQYVDSAGAEDLRVQFYVREWPAKYQKAAKAARVSEIIDIHGFVPHEEIVPVLLGSDALVHVGGNDERNRLNIPSKIADYIGAGQPMIAIVDPSFRVAELIERYSLGIVCDPADPAAVATAIRRIRGGDFEYGGEDGLDETVVRRFTRTYKVDLLADVLDAVSAGRPYDPAQDATRAVPDA